MLKVLKKIVFVAGPVQIKRYALVLIVMLGVAILEAFGVGAVLPFLAAVSSPEALIENPHMRRMLDFVDLKADAVNLVVLMGTAMIVIFVLKGLLSVFLTWLQARVLHSHRAWLSRTLFERYLDLPYQLYLDKNSTHVLHVISGVTAAFSTAFMPALLLLLSESLVCAAIIVLLVLVSPMVTVIAVAILGIVGGSYFVFGRTRLASIGKSQNEATKALNKSVIEGLGSLKETRVLGIEQHFLSKFDRLAKRYMRQAVRMNVINQVPRPVAETIFVALILGMVIALSVTGSKLDEKLPLLLLFGVAFLRLLPSFNRIIYAVGISQVQAVTLEVLYSELNEMRSAAAHARPAPPPGERLPPLEFNEALRLDTITFSYPNETAKALDGISLEVLKGEVIGLVGRSGSGKTTLVDVILGLLEPQHGDIRVDGASILGRQAEWRRLIGYIPQSIYLTDDTIRRNIAFGVEDAEIRADRVQSALEAAQLDTFVKALPDGLDTVVGDRGIRLSGGQRQRIGIARALYHESELLVLDEATSALDVETEAAVAGALARALADKTLIVIAHRLSTVRSCDRLYLIEDGRVADAGSYEELRASNEWFRQIKALLE
jgi:ATP-binding cassette subfamily C protein